MLDSLISFDAKDLKSADSWSFSHGNDHTHVRGAMEAQSFGNLVDYQLWPLPWENYKTWELRHQSAHNETNQALGLVSTDLTGVDFTDEKAAAEWHLRHYSDHVNWHEKLGI